MIESIICAILLICNMIIAGKLAKFGFLQAGIPWPGNPRPLTAAFIGGLTFLTTNLIEKYGYVELTFITQENILIASTVLLGIPLAWFALIRFIILPKGVYDYNRATIRATLWRVKHYRPGVLLESEGTLLRGFSWAQNSLILFQRAIKKQEANAKTPLNRENIVTAYEEMALLYRMMNMFSEAHDSLCQAQLTLNILLVLSPHNKEYLKLQSLIYFRQAEAYQAENIELQTAKEFYEKSLAVDTMAGAPEFEKAETRELLAKLS